MTTWRTCMLGGTMKLDGSALESATPPEVSGLLCRLTATQQVHQGDLGVLVLEHGSWTEDQILCDDGYDVQRFATISADFVRALEPILPGGGPPDDNVSITFISFEYEDEARPGSQRALSSPLAGLREFFQQVSQMLAPPDAEEDDDQPMASSPVDYTWIRLSCTRSAAAEEPKD